MAARQKKTGPKFPELLIVTVSGPPDKPYFTVHKDGFETIGRDTVVGVYKFKRESLVKVTRTLQKKSKE